MPLPKYCQLICLLYLAITSQGLKSPPLFNCLYRNGTRVQPLGTTYFDTRNDLNQVENCTQRLTRIDVCSYNETNVTSFISLQITVTSYQLNNQTENILSTKPVLLDYRSNLQKKCETLNIDPL